MKPVRKWVLAAVWLLPALVFLKVVLLLTAQPKITVDYTSEYNRICRPQNYDPNENAAPHYQKALESFIYMPDVLHNPFVSWPSDFSYTEQSLLEKWLTLNSQTFEYFRIAADKPYCWLERKTKEDNNMFSISLPELTLFSKLTNALIWDAKFKAMNGEFRSAFGNILDCYRAGRHKCRPPLFLTIQHIGLGIKYNTIQNAFIILDKSNVENKDLEFLQNALRAELDNDTYIPDIQSERFFLYDVLQRTFIDNGRGTGRLAWSAGWYSHWPNLKQRLKDCFLGPTRKQIVQQTDKVLTISNKIMSKTPWQIRNGGYDYFEEINGINSSNTFLQNFGLDPKVTFHLYHTTRAQTEALIAVLAVLRFKADTGQFPETLEELVSAGYLRSVPMDPYSGDSLVYKVVGDDFKLYSVGKDFLDDDGAIRITDKVIQQPRFGGTRTVPYLHSPDIVYWPVKYLTRLSFELVLRESENLEQKKK